tara:strand:- start:756 stop:1607 length:852 start_codon:yes stop_codon:yes gene_type:complete
MILLSSGCSHSVKFPDPINLPERGIDPNTYRFDVVNTWSDYLCEQLGAQNVNLSREGKDNNQIFNDVLEYLSNPAKTTPDIVVVQWTEYGRICLFKHRHTNKWIRGNRPDGTKFQLPHWYKLSWRPEPTYPERYQHTIQVWDERKRNMKNLQILSNTYIVERKDVINKTFALEHICRAMGVKLIYFFMDKIGPLEQLDPHAFDRIDHKNHSLIHNIQHSEGWYTHLKWSGFDVWEHNHFKEDAHKYTAERLYKMITQDTQTVTEDYVYPFDAKRPVYRYITED